MATVHCPSCGRALHLPEHRELTEAQCPLCQTTFPVARGPSLPLMPLGSIPPAEPVAPRGYREIEEDPDPMPLPGPGAEDDQPWPGSPGANALQTAQVHALGNAASWLKATSLIGLGQILTCGCFDILDIDGVRQLGWRAFLWIFWLARLSALLFIWTASDCLIRRRNRGVIRAGGIVAILLGAYMLLRSFPIGLWLLAQVFPGSLRRLSPAMEVDACVSVLSVLVGICGLVGGIRALSVIERPGVRQLFNR